MQKNSPSDHVSTLYRFCSQSMHYPSTQWLTETYFQNLIRLLETLGATEEVTLLQGAIDASDNLLEELQIEHTRLFINGVPHVAAPPYGSVYIDKSLRGKYSEEILLHYRSLGYTLENTGDLPDSLVHQLEFLSFLAEDQNIEAEKLFLSKFFLPWFPIFAEKVREDAEHPFYRIIVSLIDFFTKEEEEYGV